MSKQLYRLTLDDYSMPGFCSFSTDYIGTLEDVKSFIEVLKSDIDTAKNQLRLIEAWNSYEAGDHKVTYNAAYQENKFLARVKCLGVTSSTLTEYKWEHLNTWECPYHMQCSHAENTHIWVSYQGKYRRCIRVKFKNLQYKNTADEYVNFSGMRWGYPHMIEEEGDVTYHRMYVIEKPFKNKEEALFDMENFKKSPDIEFKYVLNDIFGDGYHTVINNNRKPESSGLNYGSKRSYSSTNKSHHNQTPAKSSDSRSADWVIVVIAIAILYFFFS